jgi:hypothetical protein
MSGPQRIVKVAAVDACPSAYTDLVQTATLGGHNQKKPPRGELTETEKRTNRKLAQIRVQVEHDLAGVKRCRIVKDGLRNTKDGVSDAVMEAAWGLHNVRDENPKRRPKT